MQIHLFLILFLSFLQVFPAAAEAPEKIKLNDYPANIKYLNYDQDQAELQKKLSSKRSAFFGQKVDYIIDYEPQDKKHHSETRSMLRDDDGNFYTIDKNVTIKESQYKALLHNANSNQAIGDQKTLVIPVGDLTVSANSLIYTPTFLALAYFSTSSPSLNTYYKEVSSNKVSFSGAFTNLFLVDNLCRGGSIFDNGGAEFLMTQVDKQIDLSNYDRVSFVFPDDNFCLAGALGVATLGNISYTNPFGKATRVSFNFNRSAGVGISNDVYFLKVITHEFGHNFGLKHDNANTCGEGIFQGECSSSFEYGGVHSIMGYSPNLAHVNAINQFDLKWLGSNQVQILNADSIDTEINLVALAAEDSSSLKAVKIKRKDGSFYTIEYRSPVGIENLKYLTQTLSYDGIQIYVNNDSFQRDSILLRKDFKVFSPSASSELLELFAQTSFGLADEFYDPISDIRIKTISVSPNGARISIKKAVSNTSTGDNGGGTVTTTEEPVDETTDPYLHTTSGSYNLSSKGVTKTNISILYNGDTLNNCIIKVTIPSQYKKFIKIKKKKRKANLVSNIANLKIKLAPLNKFQNKLSLNTEGKYSIRVNVSVFDKTIKKVIHNQSVEIFVE